MTENLKFLYFGNKKPDNEKGSQKEEEKFGEASGRC